MHQIQPNIKFSIAIGIPKKIIQIILANNDGTPPPYSISFPKGANYIDANLKHCLPYGIPTIVIHQITPDNTHESPLNSPPKINHKMFPIRLMLHSPFL